MRVGIGESQDVGQRILDICSKRDLCVEVGSISPERAQRVVVIAGWSPTGQMSATHESLVERFTQLGYATLLVLTVDSERAVRDGILWPGSSRPQSLSVIVRSNVGYDFGSWAVAMSTFPKMRSAPAVLLVNDSLVGPFGSLETVVRSFESAGTDIWGMCESAEIAPHLQSYWLGFHAGVLADGPMRSFWEGIAVQPTKTRIIKKYEVGFSSYSRRHGYRLSAMFPMNSLVEGTKNPSLWGWKHLLDRGVPMVKRDLLVYPHMVADSEMIPATLQDRYGVDLNQWMPELTD
jgi:hypothetical protein